MTVRVLHMLDRPLGDGAGEIPVVLPETRFRCPGERDDPLGLVMDVDGPFFRVPVYPLARREKLLSVVKF